MTALIRDALMITIRISTKIFDKIPRLILKPTIKEHRCIHDKNFAFKKISHFLKSIRKRLPSNFVLNLSQSGEGKLILIFSLYFVHLKF